jgi:alpha-amylase
MAALWTVCIAASTASAVEHPVMLQYFEAEWNTIRYRMPDVFMAGYGSIWLPPPQRGASGDSIGYDLFDRFDLGSDASPTHYGTENDFRSMVDAFHDANCYVYVDWIMNHNATQDHTDATFVAQGGYPGFWLDGPVGPGDFNAFSAGCPQSHQPADPCYDLFDGRLVGLIDIRHEQNNQFIRHPTTPGDPDNIPAGSIRNLPDPDNARFYPDTDLSGTFVSNPGTTRNPGTFNYTFYPYNLADPLQGDPVTGNSNDLLIRVSQYYLEVLDVDGFRLDAAKHINTWFWDNLWDAIVYERWTDFDGSAKTPLSFVEAVESNDNMANYIRKPGDGLGVGWPPQGKEFGNRDALDLNEAGALRDLISADGAGTWGNIMSSSVDNKDDGFNNGGLGVHHVNSHDNTIDDSEDDAIGFAYILMRTGRSIVYHNALQWGPNVDNFPRANGRDDALGLGGSQITDLVKIHNEYARGEFIPINGTDGGNPSTDDVLVFTRRAPGGGMDSVLVAVNDREDNGWDTRDVATTFANGTRLHELTGNADDPTVDPTNQIPNLLIVDGSGRLTHGDAPFGSLLPIPRSRNINGTFHGRGYVIYGPAVPTGTLSITGATTEVIPPDSPGTDDHIQRLSEILMITSSTFTLQLQTLHTDPLDPNTDAAAMFRIDSGFVDYNNNGGVDDLSAASVTYGFESFLTVNSPRYPSGTGTYEQALDVADLGEGFHYITVRAFRHRPVGSEPLFGEFRMVIYIDTQGPDFDLIAPTQTCNDDATSTPVDFVVQAADSTVDSVHIFVDFKDRDFVADALLGSGLTTRSHNTFTQTKSFLLSGNHRVDVVAIENLPNGGVNTLYKNYAGIQSTTATGLGAGDANHNGVIDMSDLTTFVASLLSTSASINPGAEMNCDGRTDGNDIQDFVETLIAAGP